MKRPNSIWPIVLVGLCVLNATSVVKGIVRNDLSSIGFHLAMAVVMGLFAWMFWNEK